MAGRTTSGIGSWSSARKPAGLGACLRFAAPVPRVTFLRSRRQPAVIKGDERRLVDFIWRTPRFVLLHSCYSHAALEDVRVVSSPFSASG